MYINVECVKLADKRPNVPIALFYTIQKCQFNGSKIMGAERRLQKMEKTWFFA